MYTTAIVSLFRAQSRRLGLAVVGVDIVSSRVAVIIGYPVA